MCEYPEEFERLWSLLPRRDANNPKRAAYKAYVARLKEGVKQADLEGAARCYHGYCRQKGVLGTSLVMQGATFLGPNGRWEDFKEPDKAIAPTTPQKRPITPPAEERVDGREFLREIMASLRGSRMMRTEMK